MEEEKKQTLDKLKGLAFLLEAVDVSAESDIGEHIYKKEGMAVLAGMCMDIVKEFDKK